MLQQRERGDEDLDTDTLTRTTVQERPVEFHWLSFLEELGDLRPGVGGKGKPAPVFRQGSPRGNRPQVSGAVYTAQCSGFEQHDREDTIRPEPSVKCSSAALAKGKKKSRKHQAPARLSPTASPSWDHRGEFIVGDIRKKAARREFADSALSHRIPEVHPTGRIVPG
jgi:hypothetical protein